MRVCLGLCWGYHVEPGNVLQSEAPFGVHRSAKILGHVPSASSCEIDKEGLGRRVFVQNNQNVVKLDVSVSESETMQRCCNLQC